VDGKRCVAVDDALALELAQFLRSNPKANKKFEHIKTLLLMGQRVPDLYDKEEIDEKSKGVRAMKLLKGGLNARIYCREVFHEGRTFVVIASELIVHKSTQKNSHREIAAIHRVASYKYTSIHEY
jgi:hypothetical protein